MHNERKISEGLYYIGASDRRVTLFENVYPIPEGASYNSYLILDEKTCVLDTVDRSVSDVFYENLEYLLGDKKLDYLVVHHMEMDHAANIANLLLRHPETTIVTSALAQGFLANYFPHLKAKVQVVKEGDTLPLGKRTLHFVAAPMVHWPEVLMSYEDSEGILFSADAFGKFGANDVEDPDGWACEARRYYFGIVGKYGMQVQTLLKKISCLEMKTICSLHGPVLTGDLSEYLNLYLTWSAYKPEEPGVTIAYSSVYGNTREAALRLADMLKAGNCPNVSVFDVSRDDIHEAVEDAFRYSKLVLATTTYNADIFPTMRTFIENLTERNYQNRTVALIENGSWAPMAAKVMRALLEKSKNITFAETTVTLKSALNAESEEALRKLADELCRDWQ